MPVGYLVSRGGSNALTSGDVISGGTVTFVTQTSLGTGEWVWTRDRGAQTIRWIGPRRVAATGPLAPVLVPEGALGNIRGTRVFPQHRMLIAGWQAELYHGEAEVLVAAKHLIDGVVIRSVPGGAVEYFHILFDRHEIVLCDGAPGESCYPGEEGGRHWTPRRAPNCSRSSPGWTCKGRRPTARRRDAV